jgi:signal transduction histidine kinase
VRSLRARVALLVVLAFIPAFIALGVAARHDRDEARDDTADETRALATSVAEQYEGLVSDTRTLLRAIGSIPASPAVLQQCSNALGAIVRQSPTYSNLLVLDTSGRVMCAAASPSRPTMTGSEWFRDARDTGSSVALDTDPASDDGPALTVALTINDGTSLSIVAAQIDLDGLAALVGATGSSGDGSVTLVDDQNAVLYQRPAQRGAVVGRRISDADVVRALRGADPSEVVIDDGPDDVRRIYTGARLVEPIGATVVAGIPTSVAYDGPTNAFRTRVVVLVIFTLLSVMIALLFAHMSVIRRIRKLVDMARSIGAGDMQARSEVESNDEIGELARSLDSMAGELQAREAERAHLLGAVVEASEEERRRIAGDVHDDSIQVMSAHVMRLQLLRRRVEDPELQTRIRELEESGRAATARLRDLVFELHSPTLEEHGLRAALQTLLDRAFEGVAVRTDVESDLSEEPPLPSAATAYRVVQEALRNARQHAQPRNVHIRVGRDGADLVTTIEDDGRGFDLEGVEERPGHLGLRGMRERAAAVGGTLTIESATGRGTKIVCRVPWLLEA